MVPSSPISKELPSGRPACPANRASTVGVPVDVVGRESRGEGRVPGIIGCWLLEVVDDDEVGSWEVDDERGRFRLRKDIWCLYGKGGGGVEGSCTLSSVLVRLIT